MKPVVVSNNAMIGPIVAREAPRLRLIGGFQLVDQGKAVKVSETCSRLIAFLALHRRPLSRTFVAGKLWGDCSDKRATANLRSTMYRVNGLDVNLIESDRTSLWLDDSVSVDLSAITSECYDLIDPEQDDPAEPRSVTAFGFDLLPDWYDDWVFFERERLRQLCLHALERQAEAQIERGHFANAIDTSLKAIQFEPLRESAWRILVRAHMAEGNACEARRQFERYSELLWSEMGVEPTSMMRELVQPAGHPTLR